MEWEYDENDQRKNIERTLKSFNIETIEEELTEAERKELGIRIHNVLAGVVK